MIAVKTFGASLLSIAVGLVVWYGLYLLLLRGVGGELTGGEEAAFKAGYVLVGIIGVAFAWGSGLLLSSRWRLPSFWTTVLVLFLVGAVGSFLLAFTSWGHCLEWGLKWPLETSCGD